MNLDFENQETKALYEHAESNVVYDEYRTDESEEYVVFLEDLEEEGFPYDAAVVKVDANGYVTAEVFENAAEGWEEYCVECSKLEKKYGEVS